MKVRTMKGLLASVLTLLLLLPSFATAASGPVKIATINFMKVRTLSKAAMNGQKEVEAEAKKVDAKLKPMGDELMALKTEIDKKRSVWSTQTTADKEGEFNKKASEFELKKKHATIDLQKLNARVMGPVLEELRKVITDVGKNNGYTLIVDKTPGVPSTASLLYSDEGLDISEMVAKELDKRLKK